MYADIVAGFNFFVTQKTAATGLFARLRSTRLRSTTIHVCPSSSTCQSTFNVCRYNTGVRLLQHPLNRGLAARRRNRERQQNKFCARASFTLTYDLLTLKVVSESRVTCVTSVPILVFLGLSVLELLGPMYATDRQTSASDAHHRLYSIIKMCVNCAQIFGGIVNMKITTLCRYVRLIICAVVLSIKK